MVKIAVIYYSSTGNTHEVAQAVADGAAASGAQVRLRRVRELAADATVAANPAWQAHADASRHIPEATGDDLAWADGFVLGTPTRFGLPAAQLKWFIDGLGALWATGKLQDKAAGAFCGAGNAHGGQESTLLALHNVFHHWGSVIVPVGYTDPAVSAAGGNPYGTSYTSVRGQLPGPQTLAAARYQGLRIALHAQALAQSRNKTS